MVEDNLRWVTEPGVHLFRGVQLPSLLATFVSVFFSTGLCDDEEADQTHDKVWLQALGLREEK